MFRESQGQFSNFSRMVDNFSMPFQFNVENNLKKKQTEIGGLLTLIVYSLSLAYLVYLLNLYFIHGINPNISVTTITSSIKDYFSFEEDTFAFGFFIRDDDNELMKSLIDLENETGKQYLIFQVQYNHFDDNGVYHTKTIQKKKCNNQNNLKGYFCIDYSDYQDMKINVRYNYQSNIMFEGFQIIVLKCEQQQNCAAKDQIDKLIYKLTNLIKIVVKIQRYNTQSHEFESFYITDGYGLDPVVGESRKYSLIQAQTNLNDGFLLQNKSSMSNIETIQQVSDIHSINYIREQKGSSIIGLLSFRMSQEMKYISINYVQITQVLAQSMSIYGFLLIVGQLGYKLSEVKIYQGISSIFISVYYKRSAIEIINYFNINKQTKNNKPLKDFNISSKQINLKVEIPTDQQIKQESKQQSNNQKESQQILENYKDIISTQFPQFIGQKINISFFQRMTILLKKAMPQSLFVQYSNTPIKDFNLIIDNTRRLLNVYDFFKDFIKLKMMVGLLLSKEQYAAIKFCGVDASNIQELLQSKDKKIQESNVQDNQQNESQIKTGVLNFNSDEVLEKSPHINNYLYNTESSPQQQLLSLDNNPILIEKEKNLNIEQKDQKITSQIEQKDKKNNQTYLNQQNSSENKNMILQSEDIQIQDNSSKQDKHINHLEILESIDRDETYLKLYLEKFIDKLNSNSNEVNQLDKRIYSCFFLNKNTKQ